MSSSAAAATGNAANINHNPRLSAVMSEIPKLDQRVAQLILDYEFPTLEELIKQANWGHAFMMPDFHDTPQSAAAAKVEAVAEDQFAGDSSQSAMPRAKVKQMEIVREKGHGSFPGGPNPIMQEIYDHIEGTLAQSQFFSDNLWKE